MNLREIQWKDTLEAIDSGERLVYETLEACGIPFLAYHHEASPTAEHVGTLDQGLPGRHCKNLFLKNSKADQLYLLIAPYEKNIDLKQVAGIIGSTRLSFADTVKMKTFLGLSPGSVSPFGLIHDEAHFVEVLLDSDITDYPFINFHPNVNTATISLPFSAFQHFLEEMGNQYQVLELDEKE